MPKPNFRALRGADVRLPEMLNGTRPINWSMVDPHVRTCTESGHLQELSQVTFISVHTLRQRRRKLKMPPMSAGRPRKEGLSSQQKQLLFKFNQGKRMTTIAAEMGTSTQAQYQALRRVVDLTDPCQTCDTKGVVDCGGKNDHWTFAKCGSTSPHSHVCLDCMGEGYKTKETTK